MSETKELPITSADAPLDLLIIGAGVSGVDLAHHISKDFPQWNWAIVDSNSDIGGTWNTFTYPGIRSDSDMATFAFPFKPWPHPNTLGSAEQIKTYVREVAQDAGVLDRLTLNTWISDANFHADKDLWEITGRQAAEGINNAEGLGASEDQQKTVTVWTKRVHFASGYYRHSSGFTAPIPGLSDFKGTLIHPQRWPDDVDVRGKKCVVVGSGATAITLIPSLHAMGAKTTMLQRTPTYIAPLPNSDQISALFKPLGARGNAIARNVHIYRDMAQYYLCQKFPRLAKGIFWLWARRYLSASSVKEHFRPPYNPWDQRVCKSPDGDFYQALQSGAEVVTGKIDTVVPEGVRLQDGRLVEADILIVATGLELQAFGATSIRVDNVEVDRPSMVAYRCLMLSNMPNLTYTIGYLNQSWTLRADMTSRYLIRLWKHMEANGLTLAAPVVPEGMACDRPMMEMSSGYIQRSVHSLPRQGDADPWRMEQDYVRERKVIERGDVLKDMAFDDAARAAAVSATGPVASVA
ncbi:NAD(P)-binding protein [Corynebacterium sp. zg254]|uniref:NAD(P)/FAD-dependent oxidoreductase n=1 Tax=Corynebacterium zhongnanshanii TaxID=2768834 RepID=A0ABQ6VBT4_9CORY|nr:MULTISPECIES: NAD(P)/FAD-dependent oxidoreductase [Corynebacterium]KAB3519209.1 NAD(P)/FAD-dependent oxidoreductase [Corynebacterium zhongnanshanii]MCR5915062.1 NAD(P)-binding protein [Corynebacterium sp. zg254]